MRPIEIHRILNLVAILVAKHVIDQVTLILAANFAARLVSTTAVTSRPLLVAWIATREAEDTMTEKSLDMALGSPIDRSTLTALRDGLEALHEAVVHQS